MSAAPKRTTRCPECKGDGVVVVWAGCDFEGQPTHQEPSTCGTCQGAGSVETCPDCGHVEGVGLLCRSCREGVGAFVEVAV